MSFIVILFSSMLEISTGYSGYPTGYSPATPCHVSIPGCTGVDLDGIGSQVLNRIRATNFNTNQTVKEHWFYCSEVSSSRNQSCQSKLGARCPYTGNFSYAVAMPSSTYKSSTGFLQCVPITKAFKAGDVDAQVLARGLWQKDTRLVWPTDLWPQVKFNAIKGRAYNFTLNCGSCKVIGHLHRN